jgi:lipoprotein NlpD
MLVLCMAACTTRVPAPVEERAPRAAAPVAAPAPKPVAEPDWRPPTYTVKRGDTLYAIALDHGLDYRELAAWNNIENVNLIRVGQVLRVAPPGEPATAGATGVVTAPLRTAPPVVAGEAKPAPSASPPGIAAARSTDDYKREPRLVKEPYSEQAMRDVQRAAAPAQPAPAAPPAVVAAPAAPAEAPAPVVAQAEPKPAVGVEVDDERIEWMWPAKGRIVTGFSEAASLKGIDIAGTAGQPVAASAGGKVVYAGTGLRGYGKLIIIKHNGTFLSAYAHNRDILVKEGQQVVRGQKIAEMGNTDADQVKLHFEIRRHGKPVDPLRYLPPA